LQIFRVVAVFAIKTFIEQFRFVYIAAIDNIFGVIDYFSVQTVFVVLRAASGQRVGSGISNLVPAKVGD